MPDGGRAPSTTTMSGAHQPTPTPTPPPRTCKEAGTVRMAPHTRIAQPNTQVRDARATARSPPPDRRTRRRMQHSTDAARAQYKLTQW